MSVRFCELEEEPAVEQLACAALLDDAITNEVARSILEAWNQEEEGSKDRRGEFEGKAVLGTYCHGGNRGITKRTHRYPNTTRFLNRFLTKAIGQAARTGDSRWNSIMFLKASEVPVHRDYRNEWGSANHLVRIPGEFQLWVDDDFEKKKGAQVFKDPDWASSSVRTVSQKAVSFDPRKPHSLRCQTDWVLVGYCPLGSTKIPVDSHRQLVSLGFRPLDLKVEEPKVMVLRAGSSQDPPDEGSEPERKSGPHTGLARGLSDSTNRLGLYSRLSGA